MLSSYSVTLQRLSNTSGGKNNLDLAFVYLAGVPVRGKSHFYVQCGYFMFKGSIKRHSANINL